MTAYRINLIPGDGIGVDVTAEAKRVLVRVAELHGFRFDFKTFDWSCRYYLEHGRMMPEDGLRILADCDAILLGAVGFPGVPDCVSLRELLLPIRVGFDQYVNVRPIKLLPGLDSPLKGKDIDFVVFRENSEGEYIGRGRFGGERGTPEEFAVQEALFTRRGCERIMKHAFDYAAENGKTEVLAATKSNAQNYSMVFWDGIFSEVAEKYPGIVSRKMHIDALAGYFIMHPERLQVVVASNLFGDILTDLGSSMLGSIGISPSGNINPEGTFPSMFEPIHGSAPDIAGKGIANPVGTFWAAALMLEQLGRPEAGGFLMNAVGKVLAERKIRTPDIGGKSTTAEVTSAVLDAMTSAAR